jgi:hypothetical protein
VPTCPDTRIRTVAKKSTEIVPTMLRIREDLRKRLEREAKKKDHSLNAEMVERLEQSLANEAQDLRDSAIVDMLVNHNDASSKLVRHMVSEIAKHPDWDRNMAKRKTILDWFTREINGKEPNEN